MDFLKTILSKYILQKYWKNFSIILISFVAIYLFADLISNVNIIFKYNSDLKNFILYSFLRIPIGLKFIIPISVLTASMYTFSSLNKNFEIISFRALKIDKKYLILPLIFSGFIISIITFFINEFLLPEVNYYAKYLRKVKIEKKTNFAVSKANNIWYYKNNFILRIKFLYFDSGILNDITILKFNKNFDLEERIDADYGYKKKKNWILVNPKIFRFKNGTITKFSQGLTCYMPLKIDKSDFFIIEQKSSELNIFALIKMINFLKKNKINADNFIISIFDKIFYPFISIIFILFGFYLNIRPAKTGTILSIILAVFLGGSYFMLNGFFISLSKIKYLPVFLGPILTPIIYGILLLILNKKIKY